jgi:N-methylhydantoinase B/oxoprolinase/acetone carboxylase alpha subunit
MIEYSIEELKDYYTKYNEYDDNDNDNEIKRMEINNLEETLSNIIDYDNTHNNIYHIFPIVASTFITCLIIVSFTVIG